ncbi:hypothetical protein ERU12_01045 [Escherichia coli]|nr:hypothetical protein [Escherichia coli]
MTLSKLIESEVADFFAGFGGPGEPDIQSGEAQQQLTERLLSVLALRERAEPVYQFIYNNPYEEGYTEWLDCNKDYFNGVPEDCRRILYTAPPAPVVPDELLTAMEEVLRISDRQHDAWDKAKAAVSACRAAMQGKTEPLQATALPAELRDAINRLLDSDGSRGTFSAVRSYDAREELEQLLAAEPVSQPYKLPEG